MQAVQHVTRTEQNPENSVQIKETSFIKRLKAGDSAAFKQMVNEHKDMVYNTCIGFFRNSEDAEDVSQEVFVKVYNSLASFQGNSTLSTWIYKIAVNKSIEVIRYRKREKRKHFFQAMFTGDKEPDSVVDQQFFANPEMELEQKQRAEVLFREIEKLPERQRVAFTLSKIEYLSLNEIAEIMETNISTVQPLIHRAKTNLRKQLQRYYNENEIT